MQTYNNISKWKKLNLSSLGRNASVKMNILWRLNFQFQIAPVSIKNKVLSKWHRQVMNYIWSNQRPRIKIKNLQDSKEPDAQNFRFMPLA